MRWDIPSPTRRVPVHVASPENSLSSKTPVSERKSPKPSPVQIKISESCETFPAATALFSQSDVVASASVTPSVSTGANPVPRRRFQRGHLLKRGKTPVWVGIFREDRLTPAGTIKRVQRKVVLGPCSKVSERAAYATFQPYLDKVNVAPAPLPKVGKTLSGVVQGVA
jgi:hypothetical protein